MKQIGYSLTIAGWSVDSSSDPRTELVSLETLAAIGERGARSVGVLDGVARTESGLVQQLVDVGEHHARIALPMLAEQLADELHGVLLRMNTRGLPGLFAPPLPERAGGWSSLLLVG